jgi:hypothetical protein
MLLNQSFGVLNKKDVKEACQISIDKIMKNRQELIDEFLATHYILKISVNFKFPFVHHSKQYFETEENLEKHGDAFEKIEYWGLKNRWETQYKICSDIMKLCDSSEGEFVSITSGDFYYFGHNMKKNSVQLL